MTKGPWLGEFEQLVLWSVARQEGRGYGVSIRQEIARRTGRDVSTGSVYVTLDRLERKGLVSSELGEPTARRGGRAPRNYRLEPAGARALSATRAMLERMWDGVEVDEDLAWERP